MIINSAIQNEFSNALKDNDYQFSNTK